MLVFKRQTGTQPSLQRPHELPCTGPVLVIPDIYGAQLAPGNGCFLKECVVSRALLKIAQPPRSRLANMTLFPLNPTAFLCGFSMDAKKKASVFFCLAFLSV